jgi:hypothetical protein
MEMTQPPFASTTARIIKRAAGHAEAMIDFGDHDDLR